MIDARINYDDSKFMVAYSNHDPVDPGTTYRDPVTPYCGSVIFYNKDGSSYPGCVRRLYVDLAPMEIQILTRS